MNSADLGERDADGAVITYSQPAGPADVAGLEAADVITEVDGHKVYSRRDAFAVMRLLPRGEDVRLTYLRGKRTRDATLVAGAEPEQYSFYGAYVRDSSDPEGALVDRIQRKTTFDHVLKPDDVIYRTSNVRIHRAADLTAIAHPTEPARRLPPHFPPTPTAPLYFTPGQPTDP